MTTCRVLACGSAILFAISGFPQVSAGTISGHAATLAISFEDSSLIPAAAGLSFSVDDIVAEPGSETPIAITVPSPAELRDAGAGEGTFILIRNIPEGVSLSGGMATGRIWVVPLGEARNLRLVLTSGMKAGFQLGFHLIGPGNRILAEAAVDVTLGRREAVAAITAPPPKPEAAPVAAPRNAPAKPARPQPQGTPLSSDEEEIVLARGEDVLHQGGIAAARLIFEQLAKRGSAAGALALARSYDPAYLTQAPASPALAPNMALARKWYERAAELGNPDAERRLAEIVPGG